MRKDWEQQKNESAQAYSAFLIFRDITSDRTLIKAYRLKPGFEKAQNASGSWKRWSVTHSWLTRAQAWDAHKTTIADLVHTEELKTFAKRSSRRRLRWKELELKASRAVLRAVIKRAKSEDIQGAGSAIESASKVARRALSMPVEVETSTPQKFNELFFATDGQLETAMPDGSLPEMPADVLERPIPPTNRLGQKESGLLQPKKTRPGNEH